jgi:hypothetical protein
MWYACTRARSQRTGADLTAQLSSLPNQIRRYSGEVAEYVDKTVEKAAGTVRDSLSTAEWLPDYIRPPPLSHPPSTPVVPMSAYERLQDWVSRHKILTGMLVVGAGYVTYRAVRTSKMMRKSRRARRAKNGGRLEVVVIAGSPSLPLTKSLSLDLERRGFIVYIVCGSGEDESLVQNLSRPDIRPLSIDITDVSFAWRHAPWTLFGVTDSRPLYSLQVPERPSSASPRTSRPRMRLSRGPRLTT